MVVATGVIQWGCAAWVAETMLNQSWKKSPPEFGEVFCAGGVCEEVSPEVCACVEEIELTKNSSIRRPRRRIIVLSKCACPGGAGKNRPACLGRVKDFMNPTKIQSDFRRLVGPDGHAFSLSAGAKQSPVIGSNWPGS